MPSSTRSSNGSRPEGGQATVELALALPVVVLALLLVLQVAVVAVAQVRVEHAAREAGRAAAVGADPGVPAGLDPTRTDVRVSADGAWVTAEVSYRAATDLPVVGRLTPDVVLDAAATFRVEVPAP